MGSLCFVLGSAFGAVLAWFVSCRERSRSTVAAVNGVAGGLLGILMSASWDTMTPATEAGLGFLGTAAPLTLCMTPLGSAATSARISSAVRDFAARLALALICGVSCATLGFISVESLRYIGVKENEGEAAEEYPVMMSYTLSGEPSAVIPHRL
jgi:hypothetical protein